MKSGVCMSFSDEKIQQVWEKGKVESNNDPNIYREANFLFAYLIQ